MGKYHILLRLQNQLPDFGPSQVVCGISVNGIAVADISTAARAKVRGPSLSTSTLTGEGVRPKWGHLVQRSPLFCAPDLVKFVPAVARLFCPALPGSLFMFAQNKGDLCTKAQ